MNLCNVEFYDHKFNFLFNETIDLPDIDEDYLSPSESSITINKLADIPQNGLIYMDEPMNFIGTISSVDQQDYTTTINYKPFVTIFENPVLFDTSTQGSNSISLENTIKSLIDQYWVNSSDQYQKLNYLSVTTNTSTVNWSLNLKPDSDESSYSIINLYDVLITGALTSYGISLIPVVNRTNKTINVVISSYSNDFYIDADLNNVKINSFIVNDLGNITNKLEIWNSDNYSEVIYYYLHPNGTYDTSNTNRVEPVKLSVISVAPYIGEEDTQTFAEAAKEQADNEFGDISVVNNIELEVIRQDTLILPEQLKFGQSVNIVHDATIYSAMLTGKRHSSVMVLMFGVTRVDLTKKIKLQTNMLAYSDKFIQYRSASDTRTGFQKTNLSINRITDSIIDGITNR